MSFRILRKFSMVVCDTFVNSTKKVHYRLTERL